MTEDEWDAYLRAVRRLTAEIMATPGFGELQIEIRNGAVAFVRPTSSFDFRRDLCSPGAAVAETSARRMRS